MIGSCAGPQVKVQVQTELEPPGLEDFSSGGKRAKCEVDCSPSSGTKAENSWSYTSAPTLVHMGTLHN